VSALGSVTTTGGVTTETIQGRAGRVPEEILEAWREHGTGYLGDDGFVRLLDPDHADAMLDGMISFPDGGTVVFSTGLGDLIAWVGDRWWVVQFRWGVIDITDAGATPAFLAMLQSEAGLDAFLARQPYPSAVAAQGIPGPDQCFGYVPLLALGGPATPDHLQLGGMWEHIAVILQLAGTPQPRGQLAL
jgi:hypothetical protein